MDRRLVITSSYLVLALLMLTIAGLYSPAGAPASAGVARLPQPAPGQMTDNAQAAAVVPAGDSVAMRPLAPNGMSGEFAPRLLASAGAAKAPLIYHPADRWRGWHGFRWGYQDFGIYAAATATLSC
jgi:hypothetical protein